MTDDKKIDVIVTSPIRYEGKTIKSGELSLPKSIADSLLNLSPSPIALMNAKESEVDAKAKAEAEAQAKAEAEEKAKAAKTTKVKAGSK